MNLFLLPVSLILLLSLLHIKKKTYYNSIFVISNNIIVGNSITTVAFLYFLKYLSETIWIKSKMVNMKMDLFAFPASLVLLLYLLRIKKTKTFHKSTFVISNNIIVGDSKASVAFIYSLKYYSEKTWINRKRLTCKVYALVCSNQTHGKIIKFSCNNANVIKMTIRNIYPLWKEQHEDCTERWVNTVLCL